jgi:hypothetical protein
MKWKQSKWYKHSLSITLVILFLVSLSGQIITGYKEHNDELRAMGSNTLSVWSYLISGHFLQTTFENWESEFLQMGMYVLLTISLRQVGSSESKQIAGSEEVDREPDPAKPDAPWPVKRGGFILAIYKNSLSIAFGILFLVSFILHAIGSLSNYNEEQMLKGKSTLSMSQFLTKSRFWFESFQNWQSEFIAVLSIVVLSIFLRQKGSPESKPVDAPDSETGE